MMNARLNKYSTVAKQAEKMVRLMCINHCDSLPGGVGVGTSSGAVARPGTYLIKTKTAQVRMRFA